MQFLNPSPLVTEPSTMYNLAFWSVTLIHDPGTHYRLAQIATRNGDTAAATGELALAKQGWQQTDATFRKTIALR